MMLQSKLKHAGRDFIIKIVLIILALAFSFPLIWMLMTAFKNRIDFLSIPPKWVFVPTLENFREVFSSADFMKAYSNSIIVSISAVVLGLLLGVPAAFGISRFRFKRRSDLAFWILSTRFAPPVVVLIPFFMIYKKIGLSGTHLGLILIYLIITLPLIIWLMYGFFKDIPVELEEAATVDGASPFRVFFKIVLPLVAPGLVASSILSLIFSWNELMFSLVLTSIDTRTLPVAIYNFVSYQEIAWGSLSASGMMAIVPVTVFTLLIQKYLVSGLTFGAVKN
ncbi:MAG: carbohydrate ABC transporter permease [Acetivibrionales bacterium]|jgi:multiple sugar transport system permease protein